MPESAKKLLVIFVYAGLILSTLLVYWQVRNFDFTNYDDDKYVTGNQHVLSGLTYDGFVSAFASAPAGGNWLPLTWLSFMLDCQLFGLDPGLMHLVNVLLHLANTLLLFAVLKKMTGSLWPSAFVAAAFALHPMHVESVAWITERKDVLSTFFLLLTLAAYLSYVKRRSTAGYLLTILLFVLGLMAKPMLVTLPLLLLLLDYWPLKRFDIQNRKHDAREILYRVTIEKIPFFVLAAVSSVVTFLAQRAGGSMTDTNVLPLLSRVANALLSYAKYISRMFWPHKLAVFYPGSTGSLVFWQAAICALLLVVISILVIRLGRRQKYLTVGWLWFVVTLMPVIGLVQVGSQAYADRYTYIPYIGLFIMIAWGLSELLPEWPHRRFVIGASAAIALVALGVCAHRQVTYWSDSTRLFSHAIEVTLDNYLAYNNRGVTYGKLGRFEEAVDDLRQAVRVKPDYAAAYTQLGIAYGKLGRWQEAIDADRQAIRIRPDSLEATNDLAWLIATSPDIRNRDTNEAISLARRACELSGYEAPAVLDTLGAAYAAAGRFKEAVDTANRALDLADAANQLQLKGMIQHHLSFYTQGKPYAESANRPLPDPNRP
jgi:protein O-mannosyl-transferase